MTEAKWNPKKRVSNQPNVSVGMHKPQTVTTGIVHETYVKLDEDTLRDWLAGLAMQKLLDLNDLQEGYECDRMAEYAEMAYWQADEMLLARKKRDD